MDVLVAAYTARHSPLHLDQTPTHFLGGRCARCGVTSQQLTHTTQVVSKLFTAFDGWYDPTSRGMCPPCTWGHTAPDLRQHPHLVTPTSLTRLDRDELLRTLRDGPIPGSTALVAPLHPGRKHLLPEATWGHVTTESGPLPWTSHDTARLEALLRLQQAGFGPRLLNEPAPPWIAFKSLEPSSWPHVMADWDVLTPWRHRPPWLVLAMHAASRQRRNP